MIAIYLGERLPERSSDLPEGQTDRNQSFLLIWPCSRWGLPSQPVARLLVGSYIKEFAFPRHFTLTLLGRYLSVALSLPLRNTQSSMLLRTVGVTHHRVLWSPDFPLPLFSKQQRLSSQLVNNSSILLLEGGFYELQIKPRFIGKRDDLKSTCAFLEKP